MSEPHREWVVKIGWTTPITSRPARALRPHFDKWWGGDHRRTPALPLALLFHSITRSPLSAFPSRSLACDLPYLPLFPSPPSLVTTPSPPLSPFPFVFLPRRPLSFESSFSHTPTYLPFPFLPRRYLSHSFPSTYPSISPSFLLSFYTSFSSLLPTLPLSLPRLPSFPPSHPPSSSSSTTTPTTTTSTTTAHLPPPPPPLPLPRPPWPPATPLCSTAHKHSSNINTGGPRVSASTL